MYNVRLFRIGTTNPPLYNVYMLIKMKKKLDKVIREGVP
jgi:hypothetical protein